MLFKTKNDLPEATRLQVIAMLQPKVASAADLKSQAKQAHWNVKGPNFIAYHELFDKIAGSADGFTDAIAERVMQLGGTVEGTLRAAAKTTQLPEYPLNIFKGKEHLAAMTIALSSFGASIRKAADLALSLKDQDTANMLIDISSETDKLLWFVEAHLQAEN